MRTALPFLLLLSGCEDAKPITRGEAEHIAASTALELHQGKIWELERQVNDLKRENEFLRADIKALTKHTDEETAAFVKVYNRHLKQMH